MSCNDCEKAQKEDLPQMFYRIENSNMKLCGCKKHLAMALNKMRKTDGLPPLAEEHVCLVVKKWDG